MASIIHRQRIKSLIAMLPDSAAEAELAMYGTSAAQLLVKGYMKEHFGRKAKSLEEAMRQMGEPAAAALVARMMQCRAEIDGVTLGDALIAIGTPATGVLLRAYEKISARVAFEESEEEAGSVVWRRSGGKKNAEHLRYSIIRALCGIVDPAAYDAILKIMMEDAEPDNLIEAAWALGKIGKVEAAPALIGSLPATSENLGNAISGALAALGKKIIPLLVEKLHDGSAGVHEPVMAALGKIGQPSIVHMAAIIHGTDSYYVRARAAAVLGMTNCQSAIPVLIAALKCETDMERGSDHVLREAAADALAKIGKRAIPSLIGALSHENWSVKACAIDALGTIGDASAGPALLGVLLGGDELLANMHAVEAVVKCRLGDNACDLLFEAVEKEPVKRERYLHLIKKIGEKMESLEGSGRKPPKDFGIDLGGLEFQRIALRHMVRRPILPAPDAMVRKPRLMPLPQ